MLYYISTRLIRKYFPLMEKINVMVDRNGEFALQYQNILLEERSLSIPKKVNVQVRGDKKWVNKKEKPWAAV